ncbi:MAG: STAS/SEC14 domain-containing protein [Opitutae bacterium]|nr:STAS/SEC14 domain-containing protein [Opitutae bacterium]
MPCSVALDPDLALIRVAYSGTVSPGDLQQAFQDVFTLCRNTSCYSILADCTRMTGGHTLFDLMDLISQFEPRGVPRTFKEAVLMNSPLNRRETEFYEVAAKNRGFNVRLFECEEEAVAWLND